jgi:outer membrane biosynthesis protein TonB
MSDDDIVIPSEFEALLEGRPEEEVTEMIRNFCIQELNFRTKQIETPRVVKAPRKPRAKASPKPKSELSTHKPVSLKAKPKPQINKNE